MYAARKDFHFEHQTGKSLTAFGDIETYLCSPSSDIPTTRFSFEAMPDLPASILKPAVVSFVTETFRQGEFSLWLLAKQISSRPS